MLFQHVSNTVHSMDEYAAQILLKKFIFELWKMICTFSNADKLLYL